MQCFYCPQKDVSLVPWDSLSSADQALLRDKYPDAGEGAVCEFCVRSARPSAFFSRRSSGSSSTGPQSVDSGLLVPAVDSVAVAGECEVAESSTSAKESGAQKKPGECEVAESSTSAKESGAQKKPAKPSRPDTLKKAKNPRVLKTVTIAQRVEKYGKYGLYDNNGKLYCKPCGKKMDETREASLTRHVISGIHDAACAKVIRAGAKLVLAPGYVEREEKRKVKEKEDKERADKKRKHEYVAQKWDQSRDKKYRSEVVELQRGRRRAFREQEPVSLPAELASKPSWQTILQVKDPRDTQDLPEDLVYCLMEGGRPLTILEDIRPIFRTYTSVGGRRFLDIQKVHSLPVHMKKKAPQTETVGPSSPPPPTPPKPPI